MLGLAAQDIDVVGDGAVQYAREFADRHRAFFVLLDADNGCARVIRRDRAEQLDFTALRAADLKADLHLRDFTINAIACPVAGWPQPHPIYVDPTGGVADLEAKRLRVCGPTSLTDDPLRVLRAHRFAAALELSIEPATMDQLRACAPRLAEPAGERVIVEWLKLLSGDGCLTELPRMQDVGSLDALLPDRPAQGVAWLHGLEGPLAATRRWFPVWLDEERVALLRFAALLGPTDGALDESLLDRFALSRKQQQALRQFGRPVAQCGGGWRARWATWLLSHGELGPGAWLLAAARGELRLAELEEGLRILAESAWPAWLAAPWVTGEDLKRLGATPGKQLGRALAAARLGQVGGTAADRDEALALAREVLERDGRLD